MNFNLSKILSTDGLDQNGIKLLQDSGFEVVEEKLTKIQLIDRLPQFDAIIVRSATVMDGDIIRAVSASQGSRLKVIARAGTGVDNIDMDAASECGMLVLNTPAANTLSGAEHTMALMLCLSRHVPQAYATMIQGKWDRKAFMGSELFGKTLAILGLGRIGREVASRAQAFGMRTVGYDPIVGAEEAASFKVESMTLDQIWPIADYVTVHVPLIPQTENLIGLEVFRRCKKGVYVINCARGGIVNEKELLSALETGLCGGAALDVFVDEPATFHDLIRHPKVVSTPHLGASTKEAQYRVAMEIAENLVALSSHSRFSGLVNGQIVGLLQNEESASWYKLLSIMSTNLKKVKGIEIFYDDVSKFSKQRGFTEYLKGTLTMLLLEDVKGINLINWAHFATTNHLSINVTKRQTSNPLNAPSLGVVLNGSLLEMSVWKNQVYLTKFQDHHLDQPALLRRGCHLLVTSNPQAPRKLFASNDAKILSYNVNKDLHVIVVESTLESGLCSGFEFVISV